MTTYYAAFLKPGSRWNTEKPVREQPFWDEHALYMDSLFDAGLIVLGGPFADKSGSLVIMAVDSAAKVRELYSKDPWTEQDVLVVADVKEWTIFLDSHDTKGTS
ncbi:MAG TPA: YciI family protein [Blastocatellia bacterium]|nr:YciI family protein [Blastocatellia bacterium]